MKFSDWLRGPVSHGDWVIIAFNCFVICVWLGYELAGLLYHILPRILHFFLP